MSTVMRCLALVAFLLAVIGIPSSVPLVPLGLAFCVVAELV